MSEIDSYSFYQLAMLVVVCSMIGFLVENSWIAFRFGYMDNRNMNLPFLFGYGLAALFFYATLGLPDGRLDLLYYLRLFLMISLGEILMGNAVEKICGIHYWDYSTLPLHIGHYTCVFTSLAFSMGVYLFMLCIFPPLMKLLATHDTGIGCIGASLMLIILAGDCINSFAQMRKQHSLYLRWRFDLRSHELQLQSRSA